MKIRIKNTHGYSLVELIIASFLGVLVAILGLSLYKYQFSSQQRETDVAYSQVTLSFILDEIREQLFSAGGGLPDRLMGTKQIRGLHSNADSSGFTTYHNPVNDFSYVDQPRNTTLGDGILPILDPAPFANAGYIYVALSSGYKLLKITNLSNTDSTITFDSAAAELGMNFGEPVYPVVYCSLYVSSGKFYRKYKGGIYDADSAYPLAIGLDSFAIRYDTSANASANPTTFVASLEEDWGISRVKIYARFKDSRSWLPTKKRVKRNMETIITMRRGNTVSRN